MSASPSITEQIEAIEECIEVYRRSLSHAFGEQDGEIIDPKAITDIARLEAAVETLKQTSATKAPRFPSFRMKSLKPHLLGIFWCSTITACIGFSAIIILKLALYHTPAEFSRRFIEWNGFHVVYSFVNVFFMPGSILPTPHSTGYWRLAHLVAYYTLAPLFWGLLLYSVLRFSKIVANRVEARKGGEPFRQAQGPELAEVAGMSHKWEVSVRRHLLKHTSE